MKCCGKMKLEKRDKRAIITKDEFRDVREKTKEKKHEVQNYV